MNLPSEILALFEADDVVVLIRKTTTQWAYQTLLLSEMATIPIVVTPPPPPTEVLEVITDQLNVRERPTVTAADIGDYFRGDRITVYVEPILDTEKNEWRKVAIPGEAYVALRYRGLTFLAPIKPDIPSNLVPLTGDMQVVKHKGIYRLSVKGDVRPTFGVNIRPLPYWDTEGLEYYHQSHVEPMLKELQATGVKWVRFFTPHKYLTIADNLTRTGQTLDLLQKYGMRAVICLMDSIGVTPFALNQEYHTYSTLGHLNLDWYREAKWRNSYHGWVQAVVARFNLHPAVGMWQLVNEPTIHQGQAPSQALVDQFTKFVDETGALIYSLDTTHPISLGAIASIAFAPANAPANWYADWLNERKYLHVVSGHCYQDKNHLGDQEEWEHEAAVMADLDAAQVAQRPGMIDEFGAQGGNFVNATDRLLQKTYIGFAGSSSLDMQWGYAYSADRQDIGISDAFGWANNVTALRDWYPKLRDLYEHWTKTNLSRDV